MSRYCFARALSCNAFTVVMFLGVIQWPQEISLLIVPEGVDERGDSVRLLKGLLSYLKAGTAWD
ncbi:hypothetical protein sync_0798 [Synechococcus sp. CC9311]|nr:hypothetical protein sync_0798 [Synechococcus sp. CC9311]